MMCETNENPYYAFMNALGWRGRMWFRITQMRDDPWRLKWAQVRLNEFWT